MPNVQSFSALRARSYVIRLPLFTRAIIVIMVAFWLAGLQSVWDLQQWGALIPEELGIRTMYRINTFPLIHLNFFHAFLNILALTPLLERFETEFGTLTSLALFFGPLTTIPAFVYVFLERMVLRGNTPVMGASIWVFLLLGIEAIRTYKANPHLVVGTHHVPTWITPLVMVLVVEALMPSSSFIGHLCGVGTGYLFGLGYLKFTAPPEKALRWIESRLNLLGRLPHYVSVDQKTYGRFGVLPTSSSSSGTTPLGLIGTHTLRAMSRLLSTALLLRRDPRLLKLPPYLSLLCIVVGVVWLFTLPLDDYSRRTYISENALLPGQVHTYFGGSDQNVFRAYRHEVDALKDKSNSEINDELENIFKGVGLKVGRQNYTYHSAGNTYAGENVYAILQAPRGDATEALVLVAAWKNVKDEFNRNGLALALALIRYFKRWSLWSKDIILLVPPDSKTGTQAWADAYHDAHDFSQVASLPIKSGALQGAIAIDYPQDGRFESIHIVYDGINGQLPNLDLINAVANIASGQMGMGTSLQEMWRHSDKYHDRLKTMLRGMLNQGLGYAVGPHSSFIPYHVDAITIQPVGQGWHDEMGLGRLVEGTFRSLNNLLEHLHQSFFFYLLMHKDRFVSIGTYLPSAMLIAANFTIMAIFLWVRSGRAVVPADGDGAKETQEKQQEPTAVQTSTTAVERDMFLPLALVVGSQFLGAVPLFIFNHTPSNLLGPVFAIFSAFNLLLPHLISASGLLATFTPQQYDLTRSFSLLLLGMFLSTLATLNFSLAFIVGLLASPLSFARPWPGSSAAARYAYSALLALVAPTTTVLIAAVVGKMGTGLGTVTGGEIGRAIGDALREAAFGWDVWGVYTPLIVWGVWWPAWLVGAVVVLGRPRGGGGGEGGGKEKMN
ncbi:Gaa1-like protein [Biscogniauxia mediterranea]|nr:Gaa1-like protein [Biscogniauxia mediterranea]